MGQEVHSIATDIGQHLKGFFHTVDTLETHVKEEKETAKKGNKQTLNQQALDRVFAQRHLVQMETELREMLIYQSPPELGALYTDFIKARQEIKEEQEAYEQEQKRIKRQEERKKREFWDKWNIRIAIATAVFLVALEIGGLFYLIHMDYMKKKQETLLIERKKDGLA